MEDANSNVERSLSPGVVMGGIGLAVVLGIGSLIWAFVLQSHVNMAETRLAAADKTNADLEQKLGATDARLRATTETLGQQVGMTQKQIEARTQSILASQKAEAAAQAEQNAKMQAAQDATSKQVASVSTDLGSTKTDLGSTKTDLAATKTDLESTKSQMNRMMGDEHVMSGDIATNKGELEELKHRGDRSYFEFTLTKGAKPTLVSTIKLQLKKVDSKKSKFTLGLNSDDKEIEKKDKNLDEPLQFYSGKTPMLFEIVVNSVGKNTVSGYLSTPKGAPQAMAAP